MPKVSVTIPTYNRAKLIGETINSILKQSFQDFEIIVVDDGSNDNTKEILDDFHDHRIRYTYQENQGVSAACKHCYALAAGDYVCFLSSDDLLMEDSIKKRVRLLDEHPEVSFVYGQAYIIDEQGNPIGLPKQKYKCSYIREGIEDIINLIVDGNHIGGPTIMTRRDHLNRIDIDEAFSAGSEDCAIWIRLAKNNTVAYIAEPVIKYRVHSGNLTIARSMDEEERSKKRIFDSIFSDDELAPHVAGLKYKAYYSLHKRLASHAYNCGEMKSARQQLYKALKTYPGGFFTGLGLPWIYQMIRTWVPISILKSVRRVRRRI